MSAGLDASELADDASEAAALLVGVLLAALFAALLPHAAVTSRVRQPITAIGLDAFIRIRDTFLIEMAGDGRRAGKPVNTRASRAAA